MPKTLTSSGTKRGLFTRQDFIYDAEHDHYTCPAGVKLTKIHRRVDHTEDFDRYRHLSACFPCPLKSRCTPTQRRIIKRWENEDVLDRMQARLDRMPEAMGVRRQTVEHPFGTLKAWMGHQALRPDEGAAHPGRGRANQIVAVNSGELPGSTRP